MPACPPTAHKPCPDILRGLADGAPEHVRHTPGPPRPGAEYVPTCSGASPILLTSDFYASRKEILGGLCNQRFGVAGASSEQRVDDGDALLGELVSVGLLDFDNEPMGAQQPKLARNESRARALLFFGIRLGWEEQSAEVRVAEASDCEFPAADGLKQSRVSIGPRVEGT